MGPRRVDLVGDVYGKLTVKNFDHKDKHNNAMWNCQCECGKEKVIRASSLRSGRTRSCGCWKPNVTNEIDNVYGKLTVVKALGLDKRGNALWLCQCECGGTKEVIGQDLRRNAVKSCGCILKPRPHTSRMNRKDRESYVRVLSKIENTYDSTEEEVREMLDKARGCCEICGISLDKFYCIDHNHNTGEVRGMLCSNCNIMLGLGKDSADILSKGAEYLKKRGSYADGVEEWINRRTVSV